MSTAEKAHILETQDAIIIKEFGIEELAAANVSLMKEQILEIPEKPETKEQYDDAYRFNVDAKKLLPRIEERRKELKAPILEHAKNIDDTAKKAKAMIQPLIDISGRRRDSWESEKAAEKAERDRQEAERLASIKAKLDMLKHLADKPMEYNRAHEDIARDLAHLEAFAITDTDFQERIGDAEAIKTGAIINAKAALENRKKFEAEQAEAARVRAEQEAERKRIEEANARLEAERNAMKEEARKIREAEAEEQRKANARLEAERVALEKEKAAAAHAAIVSEREAVWDVAHQFNFDFDHTAAILDHKQYKADIQAEIDQARADAMARWKQTEAAKKAKAARLKLIGPDKLLMQTVVNDFDKWVSSQVTPDLSTPEAIEAYHDLITRIKSAIHCFAEAGRELK